MAPGETHYPPHVNLVNSCPVGFECLQPSTMAPRLSPDHHWLLLRHGEAWGNCQGRMMGQRDDRLTEVGRWQAACLGQTLAQTWRRQSGDPWPMVYTSPNARAVETAQILIEQFCQGQSLTPDLPPALPLIQDDRLQEVHQGILEGLTWAEAQTAYPDLCQRLEHQTQWLPIPGAETPLAVHQRAKAFVSDRMAQAHSPIWIISHGGLLPHLLGLLLGTDRPWGIEIAPTACFELCWWTMPQSGSSQDRHTLSQAQIRRFNDRSHLAQSHLTNP